MQEITNIKKYIEHRSLNDLKVHFLYKKPVWYNYIIKKYAENFNEGIFLMLNKDTTLTCKHCNCKLHFISHNKGYGSCKNVECVKLSNKINKQIRNNMNVNILSHEDTLKGVDACIKTTSSKSFYNTIFNTNIQLFKSI